MTFALLVLQVFVPSIKSSSITLHKPNRLQNLNNPPKPSNGIYAYIDPFFSHYEKKTQDGANEPECKHIRQSTVYRKRHSRLESLFHAPARCWTSCAGDSTTKAACAEDFTTKLRLHHEGSSFCIQIKHWRKGSGRSTARKKQWHCLVPKSRKEALENDNRPHNTEKSTTAASDLLVNRSARPCVVVFHLHQQEVYETHTTEVSKTVL